MPELLTDLAPFREHDGVVIGFDRTVGDEVQAVLDDAALVVEIVLTLGRLGGWSTGLGIGQVLAGPDGRLPRPPARRPARRSCMPGRRSSGPRSGARPLRGRGPDPSAAGRSRRSCASCSRSVLVAPLRVGGRGRAGACGWHQKDVARELGISEQAVSQRLRASLWSEESAVRPVVTRILQEADA
ncbi:hypothetical protein NKG05_27765 [Oerskovia sp. M15]